MEGECIVLYVAINNQLIHAFVMRGMLYFLKIRLLTVRDHEGLVSSASLSAKAIKESEMWSCFREAIKSNISVKDNSEVFFFIVMM